MTLVSSLWFRFPRIAGASNLERARHQVSSTRRGDVGVVPGFERRQGRMRERALEIGVDPRQMPKILRLAVAVVEPGENPQNLGGALRPERRIEGEKFR